MGVGGVVRKLRDGASTDDRRRKKLRWCESLVRDARAIDSDGGKGRFGRVVRDTKMASRSSGPLVEKSEEDAPSRPARHAAQQIVGA